MFKYDFYAGFNNVLTEVPEDSIYMKRKDSFVVNLEPIINSHINQVKINNFNNVVKKWFDKNSEIMADTGLLNKPFFDKTESQLIYETTGLDEKIVKNAISESNAIDSSWQMFTTSGVCTYVSYIMYIRYLIKNKRPKDAQIAYIFLGMRIYATIYGKHFLYPPKKEVMDYTVSQLSNKFDIKRLGSFAKAFYKLAENSHEKYESDLLHNDDVHIINYLTSLRTRIKGFVQNFYNEFKTYWQSGAYLNTDKEETFEDDPTGDKKERNNDSSQIYSKAIGFQVWFVSNKIDTHALANWCRQSEVSFNEVLNVLENVQKDKDMIMQDMAAALLSLYATHTHDMQFRGICSANWIPFAISQFIKTNTDNPLIIQLKTAFDKILSRYCQRFTQTQREATRSAYRKALLLYLAYAIQKYICH